MLDQDRSTRSFVIVTDAAALGDDGVAIAMLLGCPTIDIKMIVCASGNKWAEQVEGNVHALLSRLNRLDIPVCVASPNEPYPGRIEEFVRQSKKAVIEYAGALSTPVPPSDFQYKSGLDGFTEILRNNPKTNLFITAPPTPVAALLRATPKIREEIGEVFVMGGALDVPGNATPYAEFNFWFDPKAASDLLNAGLNITLIPLDATAPLSYSLQEIEALHSTRPSVAYLREYIATRIARNKKHFPLWDETLSAVVLRPALAERITLEGLDVVKVGAKIGKLRRIHSAKQTKVKVVSHINSTKLREFVLEIDIAMNAAAPDLRIKSILMDLDNTVYDFKKSSEQARIRLARHISLITNTPESLILDTYGSITDQTAATFFKSGFQMRCQRLALLAQRLDVKFSIDSVARYFGEQIILSISPFHGAVGAIKLMRLHCPLIILTDGYADIQTAAAAKLGLGDLELFATFQHATRKSDGSAYEAIIRMRNLHLSHVVMIGDNWGNDVIAPSRLGIAQIWIAHKRKMPAVAPDRFLGSIDALTAAPTLLGLPDLPVDDE